MRLLALVAAALLACGGSSDAPPAPGPSPSPSPSPSSTASASLRYAAIGDSTGFGIGDDPAAILTVERGGYPRRLAARLRAEGRVVALLNLSVPGARLRDYRAPLDAALAAAPLGLVTACLGGNDAGTAAPADFERDLDALLAGLAPLGTKVVVCNVPDVSLTRDVAADPARAAGVRTNTAALNAAVARVAAARGAAVVDLFTASQAIFGRPELLWTDGFHPSAAGYDLWADAMWPAVRAAVASR